MFVSLHVLGLNYTPEGVENMVGNLDAIREARPGSDEYGVLEQAAFWLSQKREAPEQRNWKDAQKVTAINLATLNLSTPEGKDKLKSILRERADQASKIYASFNFPQDRYWKMGQEHLAAGFRYWDTTSIWDGWTRVERAYQEIHSTA